MHKMAIVFNNTKSIEKINIQDTVDVWIKPRGKLSLARLQQWCSVIAPKVREALSFPTTENTEFVLFAIPKSPDKPIVFGLEINTTNQEVLRLGVLTKHLATPAYSLEDLRTCIIDYVQYQSSMLQRNDFEKIEIRSNLVRLAPHVPQAFENAMMQKSYLWVHDIMINDSPEIYTRWKTHVDRLPSDVQRHLYWKLPILDDTKNRNARMWLMLAHAYVHEQSKNTIPKIPSPWHMRLDQGVTNIIFDGQGNPHFDPTGSQNALFQIHLNDKRPMSPYIEWLHGKSTIKDIPHYIDQCLNGVHGFKSDYSLKTFFEMRKYTSPEEVEGVIATLLYHDRDWRTEVHSAQQLYNDIVDTPQLHNHAVQHLSTSVFCAAIDKYIQSIYQIHNQASELELPQHW